VITSVLVLASVIFLDVLLSGDNMVVIGMAANTLPDKLRSQALLWGMAVAALTRILLSFFAIALLQYRVVSVFGGLTLLWVAYRLWKDFSKGGSKDDEPKPKKGGDDLLSTVFVIAMADVSMSLDNVLAVAGMARNNPFLLAVGLIASIALLGFGAKLTANLLKKYEWLNWVGLGLIVIIALELIFGIKSI
jgi:YjbE family integral membrane protein